MKQTAVHTNREVGYRTHAVEQAIVGIALGLIVFLLWLPFGFYSGDIQEHWHIRNLLDVGVVDYENRQGFDEIALTRPIARLLYWVAYFIDTDAFIGDNLVLMAITWGKGFALYLLLSRLFTTHPTLNFAIAAGYILYPIDEGILSIRIPHTHMAMLAWFVALNFLISYWRTPRTSTLLAIWLATVVSALSHEAMYPVLLASPLILLILERSLGRRHFRVAMLWWIAPLITLLYSMVLVFGLGFGFQQGTIDGQVSPLDVIAFTGLHFLRLVVLGWQKAVVAFTSQSSIQIQLTAVVVGIVACVACVALYQGQTRKNATSPVFTNDPKLIVGVGIVQSLLGWSVWSITDRATLVYRVFIMSSLGITLVYGAVTYILLSHSSKKLGVYVFAIVTGVVMTLGASTHMAQKQIFVDTFYTAQRDFFSQLLQQALQPNQPGVVYVIYPETPDAVVIGIHRPHLLTPAIHNVYEDAEMIRIAFFCTPAVQCQETPSGISTQWTREFSTDPYAYEDVIVFTADEAGNVNLLETLPNANGYNPRAIIDANAPIPDRMNTLFR